MILKKKESAEELHIKERGIPIREYEALKEIYE